MYLCILQIQYYFYFICSNLLLLLFEFDNYLLWIDLIKNYYYIIIGIIIYTSVSCDQNSHQRQCSIIQNEKLLNSNNNRTKPQLLRLWDIVVFRLVAYLLNMIWLNLLFSYKIWYMTFFCINLTTFFYQFLETGTSDRTLMGLDQLLKCLGFSLNPLSFFLYFPFKDTIVNRT